MTARIPDGRPLIGRTVRLDPTTMADAADLYTALDDERVWAGGYGGGPAGQPRSAEAGVEWLRDMLARPLCQRYTVRLVADSELGEAGTVVGTSTLGDFELADEKTHLGWTAYSPTVWASPVNPECKLLLMTHAFEDCGFGRVRIQADIWNVRSHAAIAKLGATREGVLRRDLRRADGSWRDTVMFSVIVDEWPQVKAGLQQRLQ